MYHWFMSPTSYRASTDASCKSLMLLISSLSWTAIKASTPHPLLPGTPTMHCLHHNFTSFVLISVSLSLSIYLPCIRRPTGIPAEDCLAAESAEAQKLLPEFKTKLSQVLSCWLFLQGFLGLVSLWELFFFGRVFLFTVSVVDTLFLCLHV